MREGILNKVFIAIEEMIVNSENRGGLVPKESSGEVERAGDIGHPWSEQRVKSKREWLSIGFGFEDDIMDGFGGLVLKLREEWNDVVARCETVVVAIGEEGEGEAWGGREFGDTAEDGGGGGKGDVNAAVGEDVG